MADDIRVVRLGRGDIADAVLEDVARLRCEVFREYPYLYDGDMAYEKRYLATLASGDGTIVLALDGQRLVGAATAMPLEHAHSEFQQPLRDAGFEPATWYYLAESVLLPRHRGRGIGVRFFDEREAAAREAGYRSTCFCAVARADDDPRRPDDHASLDTFWRRRGYAPLRGVSGTFAWREIGDAHESEHEMRYWGKTLER